MRRRPAQALVFASLALAVALAIATNGGCRRKRIDTRNYRPPKPTAVPYKPKPLPTVIWPTPRPGQPRLRPTMPG